MFPSICRRRLVFLIRQIPGDGTSLFQSIPDAIPLARSYSSTAVAGAPNSALCSAAATASYLVSCGFSTADAATLTTARNFRIRSPEKADAARALLRSYGFTDADIVRMARSYSMILNADPERIIRPKLDFFAALGFEPGKLATAPFVLARSLDKHIVPCIQFLRGIIASDDLIRLGFSRCPRALMVDPENNMRPAVEALRRCGLPDAAISKLLVIHMGVLMLSPDRIIQIFQDLKAIDMCVEDSRFLYCFRVMSSVKRETWLRKLALYKSLGLSEGEVIKAFKTQPTILLSADETIKKKVRFFVDELKLEISDIVERAVTLAYSMEKCILPRCAVLSVLMKEGKIQRDINLLPALLGSSRAFSARFVSRYADDVPDVVKAYEGKIKFEGFGYHS
ncbi:transcription termination factor MTERF8, chloroplastic [Brachypodium distachyon]|uniref:Uncharacterized protein n=1 Tax=Brachypodium distachyon TaxID=15368 RepID=I1HJK6_BRADI|nr:transcription termination factor MTERF8, chloroplastic [Brachypodium distachyon]KQK06341.1 hypothetical protein BRADI_2g25837v3 [Brachypodium distachyon]|eukprot:XP_003568493.1 transcription termination factor MTERF8, chloroplastic [Brachypodium distachyon]